MAPSLAKFLLETSGLSDMAFDRVAQKPRYDKRAAAFADVLPQTKNVLTMSTSDKYVVMAEIRGPFR